MKIRLVIDNPVFATIQGEGILSGVPSTFVRLAGCDLRCARDRVNGVGWSCDTPNSLPDYDHKSLVWRPVTRFAVERDVDSVVTEIACTDPTHVVITGGEPTLQDAAAELVLALRREALFVGSSLHVTLETNGRRFVERMGGSVSLVSLSPKVYQPRSVDFGALDAWCGSLVDVQVKIVLADVDRDAVALAERVFQHVRRLRSDAHLFVQRAHVEGADVRCAGDVVHWVMTSGSLRELGVRYGVQQHKVIGVP